MWRRPNLKKTRLPSAALPKGKSLRCSGCGSGTKRVAAIGPLAASLGVPQAYDQEWQTGPVRKKEGRDGDRHGSVHSIGST